jgi:hypothetical protein
MNIKREAGSDQNGSFQPARFALENFETFYEDKDYLVLSVPYTASTINASENVQKKEKRDTENSHSLREFKVPGMCQKLQSKKELKFLGNRLWFLTKD